MVDIKKSEGSIIGILPSAGVGQLYAMGTFFWSGCLLQPQ